MWLVSCRRMSMLTHTRSQVWIEYSIIPYTSTFIRLSHLYEEYYAHCIIITNDRGMGLVGKLIQVRVWVMGQGWVSSDRFSFFVVLFSVPLFMYFSTFLSPFIYVTKVVWWLLCVSLFSLSLVALMRSYWCIETVVSVV